MEPITVLRMELYEPEERWDQNIHILKVGISQRLDAPTRQELLEYLKYQAQRFLFSRGAISYKATKA